MTKISAKKARDDFSKVLKDIAEREEFVVEVHGIPSAVMVNYTEYKQMQEELEDYRILNNPDVIKRIKEAEEDIKKGDVMTLDELKKELGL